MAKHDYPICGSFRRSVCMAHTMMWSLPQVGPKPSQHAKRPTGIRTPPPSRHANDDYMSNTEKLKYIKYDKNETGHRHVGREDVSRVGRSSTYFYLSRYDR